MAGLIQASDGNFYGTTAGVGYYGTIFKITPGGALTTLHVFSNGSDGAAPMAPLVQGTDGSLYGTTGHQFGAGGHGTVFRITPSGTFTTLYSFCAQSDCLDGNNPVGGLIQAKDGNFYGTTRWGGTNATGAIYKITPAGLLTTLYSFGLSGGAEPMGNLVQAKDGNFYGTTSLNNVSNDSQITGTVFKMTPAGSVTTLYTFDGSGWASPNAGLMQASDGNLYGTTAYGGAKGDGSIFEITPAGVLTTVHSFDPNNGDGVTPLCALVQGSNGKLYGTTSLSATSSNGTVFSETIASPPSSGPVISTGGIISAYAFGGATAVAPGSWIEIYGTNLAADARAWIGADFNGVNAPTSLDGTFVTIGGQRAFVDYISPGQVNVQVPSNVGTGQQPVIVNSADGASAALTLTVNLEQPGFLAPGSFKVGGTQYVVALFSDGSTYVLPPGAVSGVTSRRAKSGDVITLYGIGFGAVTPNIPAGQIVQQSNTLTAPFHLLFGQTEAHLNYDGLAPSAVGLYQFNVVVPNVTPSDAVPVTFTLAGAAGTQTLYIAVQN